MRKSDHAENYLFSFCVHFSCVLPYFSILQSLPKESVAGTIGHNRQQRHSYIIPGLRMSTNYTFEVRPVTTNRMEREFHNSMTTQSVVLSTKGCETKFCLSI